jgi:deazaflavin-dependent oxidoreductase (nitroreductase family)
MKEATAKALPVPASKTVLRLISKLNVVLYRLSGGRIMGKMGGTPVCLVTITGRKSGKRITIPLMYNPDGENVILVASLGGAPKNPIWYHNIIANPNVIVQVGRLRRNMHAEQASPTEKARLWPSIIANFPSYAEYQRKTDRDIPVIVCTREPS